MSTGLDGVSGSAGYGRELKEKRGNVHEAISHGLRTPLTSVVGFSTLLVDRWHELDDGERLTYVNVIQREAIRMAHSVEFVDRHLYDGLAHLRTCERQFKDRLELADAS